MDEQRIWSDFKANGKADINYRGQTFTITELTFWREDDNENFIAGYTDPRHPGHVMEDCNIPDHALEAICPDLDIEWNSAEANHSVPLDSHTESLMAKIESIFVGAGFVVAE